MRAVDREKPVPRSTRGIAPPPPRRRPVVHSVGSFRVFTRWTYQRRSRDARSTARHVPRRRFRAAPVTSCRCRRPPERRPRRTQATFFTRGQWPTTGTESPASPVAGVRTPASTDSSDDEPTLTSRSPSIVPPPQPQTQMLKGGVIMDVVNVEQARIAEEAGAVALSHPAALVKV